MKKDYELLVPAHYSATEAKAMAKPSQPTIITGIPTLVDSKSRFTGFIMIPITTNNVTNFIMVPIHEKYDIYEVRDSATAQAFFIAHAKSSHKLPANKIQCAGVVKELSKDDKKGDKKELFLEVVYYRLKSQSARNI